MESRLKNSEVAKLLVSNKNFHSNLHHHTNIHANPTFSKNITKNKIKNLKDKNTTNSLLVQQNVTSDEENKKSNYTKSPIKKKENDLLISNCSFTSISLSTSNAFSIYKHNLTSTPRNNNFISSLLNNQLNCHENNRAPPIDLSVRKSKKQKPKINIENQPHSSTNFIKNDIKNNESNSNIYNDIGIYNKISSSNNINYNNNYHVSNAEYNISNNSLQNNNIDYNTNNSSLNDNNLKDDHDKDSIKEDIIEGQNKNSENKIISESHTEIDVENINNSQIESPNRLQYHNDNHNNSENVTTKKHKTVFLEASSAPRMSPSTKHTLSTNLKSHFSNHSISSLSSSNPSDQKYFDSRFSIIKTNPSITSLLLHKHTTAFSCKYSASVSSSFLSNLPQLSTTNQTIQNNNDILNSSVECNQDSHRSTLCTLSSSKTFCSISSTGSFNSYTQPSLALRNLLLKPSCLGNKKINKKKQGDKGIGQKGESKHDSNIKSFKYETGVFGSKCKQKYESDNFDLSRKEMAPSLSPANCSVGCSCGCGFCPPPSDNKLIKDKNKGIKISESFTLVDENLKDSKSFENKIENSLESSLLFKDGYKHNGHFVISKLQQNTLSDKYMKNNFYFNNGIYVYDKNKGNLEGFSKTEQNILRWLKEKKKMDDNSIESKNCCSQGKNSLLKSDPYVDTFPTLESKNNCLSKRKFIELKNKLSPLGSVLKSKGCCDSYDKPEENEVPCCKRNRSCCETAIPVTFNICSNNCNPASCQCSSTQDNCSMKSCRKETTSEDSTKSLIDNSSTSDSSTVSVASVKTENDQKFISPFKVNAETQWKKSDFKESFFYQDFSSQCSLEDEKLRLNVDKCALCNCCLPLQNSIFSVSPSHSSPSSSSINLPSTEDHQRPTTKDVDLKCFHCGIIFDDEVIFSIHMGSHSHQNPFTCNLCGKNCSNKYGFNTHIIHGHHFSS